MIESAYESNDLAIRLCVKDNSFPVLVYKETAHQLK